MKSPHEVKAELVQAAKNLGFADVRIAAARKARHSQEFANWIMEGRNGDMAWMARDPERRSNPELVLPGAKSVIMLAVNYYQGPERPQANFRVARYAWNDDYHDLITPWLQALDKLLQGFGGLQRVYVDTGPVLERDFASESGLGWGGKSTMQIHRSLGTWFFLASIITTLDLPPDDSARDHCGTCTRCIQACPTQAITAPRSLDARRCVSYLTIEHKGAIPEEFRAAIGDRLYGCDDCLDACPWNKFAQKAREMAFEARRAVFDTPLRDYLSLTEEQFRQLFAKSPIKRIKRTRFLRNVCVVLGNVGTTDDLPALEQTVHSDEPLVAEHAAWAVGQILKRQTSQI
ncbi:MAG: tRNA epoxyqueuosine(34) reductase QueG [Verrucomicrobiaceae bacterium]|nr:tRNA epoxyqueuosine(34) reductase QueG [Verrucomicrobiaceae bacterium]